MTARQSIRRYNRQMNYLFEYNKYEIILMKIMMIKIIMLMMKKTKIHFNNVFTVHGHLTEDINENVLRLS